MRWSEAVTFEFVKIYLRQECLWNPAHPGYRVKYQREKAYIDICEEFKTSTIKSITVPEVKLKIKNLRTTYAQEVHKILQKSNPDSIYEPSLIWFHEMDNCLKNISSHRHLTRYNNISDNPESDSLTQIWMNQELLNSSTEDMNPDPLIHQKDDYYDIKQEELDIKEESSYERCKKKKINHRSSSEQSSEHSLADKNVTDISTSVAIEDEFDIYGKFIALQLRSIGLPKALKLQLEIHNLVNEARLTDLNK